MLTPPAHRRGAGPAGIAATAIALLRLLALPVSAQLSPRNANYTIDARLDPVARTIDGRATLVWRNLSDRPATDLRFHLYWNAWAHNRSTWMRERRQPVANRCGAPTRCHNIWGETGSGGYPQVRN